LTSFQPALGFWFDETLRRWREAGKRVLVVARGGEAPSPGDDLAHFDAAWIAPATLEDVDVSELGQWVASVLRPGAPVVCSIPGCWPLPALLERALRGTGELPRPDRARVEGNRAPCISASSWREAFGPEFTWHRARAVGALLPVRPPRSWADEHARMMYGLGAMEQLLGSWPIVRGLGDRALLEGVRR
jgi:hypothetical protein